MSEQYKRHTAFKLRIGDILLGKPTFEQDRFSALELGNKRIVRVNVVGNIIDKYKNDGDKKYSFVTLDDGSGQIKLKSFGEDIEVTEPVNPGETVVVIGVLRNYNNETYIAPEIAKVVDPKYLLVRKLELEHDRAKNAPKLERKEIVALRDQILEHIKKGETEGGAEVEKIMLAIREASPDIITQEIQKLIEEGIVFEPRPGKLRWLG